MKILKKFFSDKSSVMEQEVKQTLDLPHVKEETEQDIIKAIHKDFDEASEKALNDAKEILAQGESEEKEEILGLADVGFTSLREVQEVKQQEQKVEMSKDIAEKINYYIAKYPNHKYISKQSVVSICKKYGLILGESSNYIGTIPKENRKDILAFKIEDADKLYKRYDMWGDLRDSNYETWLAGKENATSSAKDRGKIIDWKETRESNRGVSELARMHNFETYNFPASLEIVAPLKDFKISPDEYVKDNQIMRVIKDPVVLQPLKDGYLIVTKWGLEADIKEFK